MDALVEAAIKRENHIEKHEQQLYAPMDEPPPQMYEPTLLAHFQTKCTADPSFIPKPNTPESQLDEQLCGIAVDIAVERHSGRLETTYTPYGQSFYQQGKDLTDIKYVIGIGGPIIYSQNPQGILQNATTTPGTREYLKPTKPKYMIDHKYIFAAMGLVSRVNKQLALKMLQDELASL